MTRLTHRLAIIALSGLALAGLRQQPRRADRARAVAVTTIGVNTYLWRAAIDTLSFAPLLRPIRTAA